VIAHVMHVHRASIGDETSNQTLPEWDSLNHVNLILSLEAEYGVSFSPEEALEMTCVAALKRTLARHGVNW